MEGIFGEKGDHGETFLAPKGEKGERGAPGAPYKRPSQVMLNKTVIIKGEKGYSGDDGEKGEAGSFGDQGAQGFDGPAGVKGEPGEVGDQGPFVSGEKNFLMINFSYYFRYYYSYNREKWVNKAHEERTAKRAFEDPTAYQEAPALEDDRVRRENVV